MIIFIQQFCAGLRAGNIVANIKEGKTNHVFFQYAFSQSLINTDIFTTRTNAVDTILVLLM